MRACVRTTTCSSSAFDSPESWRMPSKQKKTRPTRRHQRHRSLQEYDRIMARHPLASRSAFVPKCRCTPPKVTVSRKESNVFIKVSFVDRWMKISLSLSLEMIQRGRTVDFQTHVIARLLSARL